MTFWIDSELHPLLKSQRRSFCLAVQAWNNAHTCKHAPYPYPVLIWTITHYVTKSMWTLERLSTRIGNLAEGICSHSARRALVRSGTDVEQYGLGHSWHSSSSQKCVDGIKVLDLCRPVKFFQTKFKIPISVWSWFQVRWYCDVETGKGLPQTVATKLMPTITCPPLYAIALAITLLELTMKN